MTRYGFIGLGIMGSAMASNLRKEGCDVTVWNRTAAKCAPLLSMGAEMAKSPRQVVEECPVTFTMVADPAAAEEVCFGADGALEGISDGKGYVDMSTVDPATAIHIGEAVVSRGGRFLEAPVSGTRKPAEEGTLVFLNAGDRSLYDEIRPALEIMGKSSHFLGRSGSAARMKLVINMIMGGMMTALCEGMSLGEKNGLSGKEMLDILGEGALANPMFKIKGDLIQQGNYQVSFPLKHMQKDLRLALQMGDDSGQPLFAAAAVNEYFKAAGRSGWSEEDFAAVYKVIRGEES